MKMTSDTDTIKDKLFEPLYGLSEEKMKEIYKHYFDYLYSQLIDPKKPELLFGVIGRFKVSPMKAPPYAKGIRKIMNENGENDEGLRKIKRIEDAVRIATEVRKKGKTVKNEKRK